MNYNTYELFSNLSSPISVNSFYTWCNLLLTGLHHSSVVSIPLLLLPSNSSTLPLTSPHFFPPLRAREFGTIITIITQLSRHRWSYLNIYDILPAIHSSKKVKLVSYILYKPIWEKFLFQKIIWKYEGAHHETQFKKKSFRN